MTSPILRQILFFGLPNTRKCDFSILIVILFKTHHSCIFSKSTEHNRSSWRESESEQVNVVSSAWAWADDDKDNVDKSWMNMKNRVGASIEPCGTPTAKGGNLDTWFEQPTNCLLSTKKRFEKLQRWAFYLEILELLIQNLVVNAVECLAEVQKHCNGYLFLLFISNIR